MKALTFGDIRPYMSRIDRISICMEKTLRYQNYEFIQEVPHEFDSLYLYGFGVIYSENKDDCLRLSHHMEFMLSEKPRDDL